MLGAAAQLAPQHLNAYYLRMAIVAPSPGAPGIATVTGTSSPAGAPAGIWMLIW
jgi:hypothetical protein